MEKLFQTPQEDILSSTCHYVDYRSTSPLNSGGPVEFFIPAAQGFPGDKWKCGLVEVTLTKLPPSNGARIEADFVDTTIISHKKSQMLRYMCDGKRQNEFKHIIYVPIIVSDVEVINIRVVNNNTNTLCETDRNKTSSFILHFKSS